METDAFLDCQKRRGHENEKQRAPGRNRAADKLLMRRNSGWAKPKNWPFPPQPSQSCHRGLVKRRLRFEKPALIKWTGTTRFRDGRKTTGPQKLRRGPAPARGQGPDLERA